MTGSKLDGSQVTREELAQAMAEATVRVYAREESEPAPLQDWRNIGVDKD